MQLMKRAKLGTVFVVALVVVGCARAGQAQPTSPWAVLDTAAVSSGDLAAAGVAATSVDAGAPPPKVTLVAAEASAFERAFGAGDRGPVVTAGRAMAKANDDPTTSARTAWVIVIGPGGLFQPQGPERTPTPIQLQIIVVDDPTGDVVAASVISK
jgi:hypothetical protein